MTQGEKAIENLQTIKQILEKSKMNPTVKDITIIFKLAEVTHENN